MYEGKALDYFPFSEAMPSARTGQIAVINEVDKVIKSGKKLIIIEGPVGCGKSAIALTFAKAFNSSHLITPRKSLQDQYFEDFGKDVVLMKGRAAYPCVYETPYNIVQIFRDVKNGQVRQPILGEANCAASPCRNDKEVYTACVKRNDSCPYSLAMETAQQHPRVIHNLHSFIFQTNFTEKFTKRELLVIDEAHDIEGILREFTTKKLTINKVIATELLPEGYDIETWCEFFLTPDYIPLEDALDIMRKKEDENYKSRRDEYIDKVLGFKLRKDFYKDNLVIKTTINKVGGRDINTSFEFIPESLGNSAEQLLFSMGEYVILMSGTIYGKDIFCKNLGISQESAHYIRIPSTFPAVNRPIILKSEYQVDTSFANWNDNFREMIEKMDKIAEIFSDAKGLIHAPSYEAAEQIANAMKGQRVMTHGKSDFQDKLQMFFDSQQPLIFISPVCSQGVDFKEDRARFQIITRVPYQNTSDTFINHKVKTDFSWYNYQALITFGQQIGRINRSESDYGVTFCLDSRFNSFITKNLTRIPKWVQAAFKWR